MWKTKLCMNLIAGDSEIQERLALYRKTGFEGFFVTWREGIDLLQIRRFADEEGMLFQSVHAPFSKAADMWRGGEGAAVALDQLLRCAEDVAAAGVKIMVCHTWIGFDTPDVPNPAGVENYRRLVERAGELGVQIAFENTEGEEFLDTLMEAFADQPHVGFCLDTGHELCYNRGRDLLAKYGDRLIATHINDNLGIKDYDGRITYLDDLHLLPFDGVKDWSDFGRRMKKLGYQGELTFELKISNQKNRHENDVYLNMPFEQYLTEAYKRACRVAVLVQG